MTTQTAAWLIAIALHNGSAPQWIHILPAGQFNGHAANNMRGPWQAGELKPVNRKPCPQADAATPTD